MIASRFIRPHAPVLVTSFIALAFASVSAASRQHASPEPPQHQHQHAKDPDAIDRRGDRVMGFSHEKSQHHFRLTADGGRIEVTAAAADDEATIGAIRAHLKQVVDQFGRGEFGMPHAIHDRELPGVAVMRAQHDAIAYVYEDIAQGGRVTLTSRSAAATSAIHDFLRAQIADHRTGDPTAVEAPPPTRRP